MNIRWGFVVERLLLSRMQWNRRYLGQKHQKGSMSKGRNASQQVQVGFQRLRPIVADNEITLLITGSGRLGCKQSRISQVIVDSSDVLLSYSQVSEKPQQVIKINDSFAVMANPQFCVVSRNFSSTIRALKQHLNSPTHYNMVAQLDMSF